VLLLQIVDALAGDRGDPFQQRAEATRLGLVEGRLVLDVVLPDRLDQRAVVGEAGERGLELRGVVLLPVEHPDVEPHVGEPDHLLVDERVAVDGPVPARRDDRHAFRRAPAESPAEPQRESLPGVEDAVVELLSVA
jgi:hypothetical protein